MNLTVFGAGHVGLVTGACFAEMGNSVVCVDIDSDRVDGLERGIVPIHEPGLVELLANGRRAGRLRFTTNAAVGVGHGDLLFIAVDTPPEADGSADLSHVLDVAAAIGRHMDTPKIVVDKSTVPVGAAERVRERIASILSERGASLGFHVVSNPEFLKQGAAVADFMQPDRVIIGSSSPDAAKTLERLYAPLIRSRDRVVHMDVRSAELTKYAANAMLATRITLMNELASVAERVGADIEAVRHGIAADPRIGSGFLHAGVGLGGSCFPKDMRALVRTAQDAGCDTDILCAVTVVNLRQKAVLFNKIRTYFTDQLAGRTVALWGLAFKPGTDDMRGAPSRVLMERLWEAGASVRAYDPAACDTARKLYGERTDLVLCDSRDAALEGADVLAVVTEWEEFRSPDFGAIKRALRVPAIFDGRNLYDPANLRAMGLDHFPIGRPASSGAIDKRCPA